MHSHNVYFWLKEGLSKLDLHEFEKGLESLTTDPNVVSGFFGKPANTSRPVIDSTYTYGLSLLFKDTPGHDLYQAGPIHLAFVDKNAIKWARVQVYDVEFLKG